MMEDIFQLHDAFERPSRAAEGERELWCAVIDTAVRDRDREWFTRPDSIFPHLCNELGLDADMVRTGCLQVIDGKSV